MHNPIRSQYGIFLRIFSDQYITKYVQYEQSQLLIQQTIMIDIDFVSDQYKIWYNQYKQFIHLYKIWYVNLNPVSDQYKIWYNQYKQFIHLYKIWYD